MIILSLVAGLSLLAVPAASAAATARHSRHALVAKAPAEGNVFDLDQIGRPIDSLGKVICLAPETNFGGLKDIYNECVQAVSRGDDSTSNCDNTPNSALVAICLSIKIGIASADGTLFNGNIFERYIDAFKSSYSDWVDTSKTAYRRCKRLSAFIRDKKQRAVAVFTCWYLRMVSYCDRKEERRGLLSQGGEQRQSRFLAGSYTLSPITLATDFGLVTEDTLGKCTAAYAAYATDITSSYEAEIGRVVCLLQDFKAASGNIDFDKLTTAISGTAGKAGYTAVTQLLNLLKECKTEEGFPSTVEAYAKCWAAAGVESRTFPEAKQLADTLPETCAFVG